MKKFSIVFSIACITLVSLLSCVSLESNPDSTSNLTIRMTIESVAEEDLDDYDMSPIYVVTPSIDNKSVYIGDTTGVIEIENVPEGSYNIHLLYTSDSKDKTIHISSGNDSNVSIEFPKAMIYYYVINSDTGASGLEVVAHRSALIKALDRSDIITTNAISGTAAYNMILPEIAHDGLTDVSEYTESTIPEVNTLLSGTVFQDMEILFNTDNNSNRSIAEIVETRWESLDSVSSITLVEKSWNDYVSDSTNFNFDIRKAGWVLDSNNVLQYFQAIIEQSGYSDSTLTTLLTEAEDALNEENITLHTSKLKEIHDYIIDKALLIPIYYFD